MSLLESQQSINYIQEKVTTAEARTVGNKFKITSWFYAILTIIIDYALCLHCIEYYGAFCVQKKCRRKQKHRE